MSKLLLKCFFYTVTLFLMMVPQIDAKIGGALLIYTVHDARCMLLFELLTCVACVTLVQV